MAAKFLLFYTDYTEIMHNVTSMTHGKDRKSYSTIRATAGERDFSVQVRYCISLARHDIAGFVLSRHDLGNVCIIFHDVWPRDEIITQ